MTSLQKIIFGVLTIFMSATLTQAQSETKSFDHTTSSISWEASKITGSTHTGTLAFKSGEMVFIDGKLTGASFVVDMNSLDVTDLKGGKRKKLINHLQSDDFFSIAKYPESTLTVGNIRALSKNKYLGEGTFTIKGNTATHKIEIELVSSNKWMAKAIIDRTKHDIRYGSKSYFNVGNRAINDDFTLEVLINL